MEQQWILLEVRVWKNRFFNKGKKKKERKVDDIEACLSSYASNLNFRWNKGGTVLTVT